MELNYKVKQFSPDEISKRIESVISLENDSKIRLLLMNLSNTKLLVLKPLAPDIQEICDCLFLKKHMAALTLTNLLFETMVKLTLVYHEADGRTIDDGYDFETMYERELNKYGDKCLGNNVVELCKKGVITSEERDRLLDLKDLYRNPYSHGSNNQYVKGATTTLVSCRLGSDEIKESRVSVIGNPFLLLDARRTFIERFGLSYFTEIMTYIDILDKKLYELYHKHDQS